jgi:hypothetical protein
VDGLAAGAPWQALQVSSHLPMLFVRTLCGGIGMLWRIVLVLVSVAGCGGVLTPADNRLDLGQYFTLRTARDTVQAKLAGPRFFGPDLELALLPDGYRGHSISGLIDLRSSTDDRIYGTVGSVSTELYYEQTDDGFILEGLYNGKLGTLTISPERLNGSVGGCAYDLERGSPTSAWYHGQRACRGAISGVQLELPLELVHRSAADRAVLLAVFLGG